MCSPRPAHQNPHPHPLHRARHRCPLRVLFWRNALVFFSLDDNTLQSIAAPTAGPNGTGDLLAKDTGISAPSSFTRTVSEPCVHSFPCRLCVPVCYPVFVVHMYVYVCDKGRAIVAWNHWVAHFVAFGLMLTFVVLFLSGRRLCRRAAEAEGWRDVPHAHHS